MTDICREISEGLAVYNLENGGATVMQHQGFGLKRDRDEADLVAPAAKPMRAEHFVWPAFGDLGQQAQSVIFGEFTAEARETAERHALEFLKTLKKDATALMWRAVPTWESETSFETRVRAHRLFMRGAFLWPPE